MRRRDVAARAAVVPPSTRLAALAAAALFAASACGGEPPAVDAAQSAGAAAAPSPASHELRFVGGSVSVAREEVLQLALLEELAERAGFELEVGVVAPRNITLRLDDVPLLAAISAILESTAFRAEYAIDPRTGAHVLARLSVGEVAPPAPPATDAKSDGDFAARRERKAHSENVLSLFAKRREDAEKRTRLGRASAEERLAREAAAIEQLVDADAERRAEALAVIDPSGDAFSRISELAKSDPDPRVRAVAVERLGEADSYEATTALLDTLADPSPQVLIVALEALEFTGDRSLLSRIEPLANHPDPAVREAANDAIESLR